MRKLSRKHQYFQGKSANPASPSAKRSHAVHPIPQLQRTIGNQAVQRLLHAKPGGREPVSDATASGRFGHDFSQIPQPAKASVKTQAKLPVFTSRDVYKEKAGRVYQQAMRMSEPKLQHDYACGSGCLSSKVEPSTHEHLKAQRVHTNDFGKMVAPPIVEEVLSQTGQPLEALTRAFAEPRLGGSFKDVRIHMDKRAAASAEAIEARAYSIGNRIVFSDGEFQPHTQAGRRLLLHELVHTMQMRRGDMIARTPRNGCTTQRMHVTDPDAIMIRQIVQVADSVDSAIFMLQSRLSGAWWFDQEERDRIDFFFNCPTDARLQEIIADLGRLRAILGPSFPYRCGSRPERSLTMEHVFVMTSGQDVLTRLLVRASDFAELDFLRWNILAVGLRLIGFGFAEKMPYLKYVRREAPGVLTCRPTRSPQPQQPAARSERITVHDLGLSRNTLIFVRRTNGIVTGWQWEPRRSSPPADQGEWHFHGGMGHHPVALGTPYEWRYDESVGRVFIIVEGQRVNLLPHGRVEIQR